MKKRKKVEPEFWSLEWRIENEEKLNSLSKTLPRVYMNYIEMARKEWGKKHYGLVPFYKNNKLYPELWTELCPNKLVGKRCTYGSNFNDGICICIENFGVDFLENSKPWIQEETGELIIIGEPFRPGRSNERIDFMLAMKDIGLKVSFNKKSTMYPGENYGVWIRKG
jgi:hypothetical protein